MSFFAFPYSPFPLPLYPGMKRSDLAGRVQTINALSVAFLSGKTREMLLLQRKVPEDQVEVGREEVLEVLAARLEVEDEDVVEVLEVVQGVQEGPTSATSVMRRDIGLRIVPMLKHRRPSSPFPLCTHDRNHCIILCVAV